jgi:hypothetical protein
LLLFFKKSSFLEEKIKELSRILQGAGAVVAGAGQRGAESGCGQRQRPRGSARPPDMSGAAPQAWVRTPDAARDAADRIGRMHDL